MAIFRLQLNLIVPLQITKAQSKYQFNTQWCSLETLNCQTSRGAWKSCSVSHKQAGQVVRSETRQTHFTQPRCVISINEKLCRVPIQAQNPPWQRTPQKATQSTCHAVTVLNQLFVCLLFIYLFIYFCQIYAQRAILPGDRRFSSFISGTFLPSNTLAGRILQWPKITSFKLKLLPDSPK